MTKLTILLVHGAWHDSNCWKYFLPHLTALGFETKTLDLPAIALIDGINQFDDAAAVHSALEPLVTAGKRVVVLAHSYSGPIASAGIALLRDHSSVLGLIVLCGYIFPGGMDQGAILKALNPPFFKWDTPRKGFTMPLDPHAFFYKPDVPEELIEWAEAGLKPHCLDTQMGIVPPQVWQDEGFKGGFGYIRTLEDGILKIAEQDGMIEAAGGKERWVIRTLEGSGHSPFLSRPEELARVVDDIVGDFEKRD